MENQAADIAKRAAEGFGVLQCQECCKRIQQALSEAGFQGQIIEIRGAAGRDFMICMSHDAGQSTITQNGRHLGVRVAGLVFDNLHRAGMLYEEWLKDFDAIGGIEILRIVDF
jgi:Papain fold toxin 2